jgi:hypothetical protein
MPKSIPSTETERQAILKLLRQAVVYQIGVWDTATEMAQAAQCDLSEVLDWVNHTSITADDGMKLGNEDLNEFLGLRVPAEKRCPPLPDAERRLQ